MKQKINTLTFVLKTFYGNQAVTVDVIFIKGNIYASQINSKLLDKKPPPNCFLVY